MMFKNLPSTQDFLSDSQRTNNSSDSAVFSFSQRQQSQTDFSQVKTQDLFTQNQNCGSQSEYSFPLNKKMNMYDKWMCSNKGSLLKRDSSSWGKAGINYLTSHQSQSKSKESDERDLLQQAVHNFQDCNNEVKQTLLAFKERMKEQLDICDGKNYETMKAFLEDVWKHEERVLAAVTECHDSEERILKLEQELASVKSRNIEHISEVEKQLAVRNEEAKQLHAQLQDRDGDKPEQWRGVAKAVRQELLSPHLAVENKLMQILETTREVSEQQSDQLIKYRKEITQQNEKLNKEWKSFQQKLLKDTEKRLQKDINNLKKDIEKLEQGWKKAFHNQLSEASCLYLKEVEAAVEKAVNSSPSKNQCFPPEKMTTVLVDRIKKELQGCAQRHLKAVERSLPGVLTLQFKQQQQNLQALHQSFLDGVNSSVQLATKSLFQQQQQQEAFLSGIPKLEEKLDGYHSELANRLDQMQNTYIQETRDMNQFQCNAGKQPLPYPSHSVWNHKPDSFSQHLHGLDSVHGNNFHGHSFQNEPCQENIDTCPRSSVSCHRSTRPSFFNKENSETSCDSCAFSHLSHQAISGQKHMKGLGISDNKTKFLGTNRTLSCGNTKRKTRNTDTKSQLYFKKGMANTCHPKFRETSESILKKTKEMNVYCISEDENQEYPWCNLDSVQVKCKKQRRIFSPTTSMISFVSSPAASVTIDNEVVVVRRSRWQTVAEESNACVVNNADITGEQK